MKTKITLSLPIEIVNKTKDKVYKEGLTFSGLVRKKLMEELGES